MSIKHMIAHGTLGRNIEMSFAYSCTGKINIAKGQHRLANTSARNSIERLQKHIALYIKTHPGVLAGKNPMRNAYKAFANECGVTVSLLHANSRHASQLRLF